MKRVAVADLSRACKEFKITFNPDFKNWVTSIDNKDDFIQTERTVNEFPEEMRFILNQMLYASNIKDNNYLSLTVRVIHPAPKISKLKRTISSASSGTLDRIISIVGHREKFTFRPIIGSADAPSKFLFSENCFHLYNGAGCAFDIEFDDSKSSLRPPRDGFRSGTMEKKDPTKRIIIIVDVEPSDDRLNKTMEKVSSLISSDSAAAKQVQYAQQARSSSIHSTYDNVAINSSSSSTTKIVQSTVDDGNDDSDVEDIDFDDLAKEFSVKK